MTSAPPERRRRSPAESLRERLAAHSDEERDRARARLRIAQATFTRVEPDYWAAVDERYKAAAHGFEVGLTTRQVAALLGDIPSGHVHRMREKEAGGDTYAARRYARSQARRARMTNPQREDLTP